MKVRNSTDIGRSQGRRGQGLDLDRFAAPAYHSCGFTYLMGVNPWSMVDHALAWMGEQPCPICNGEPFAPREPEPGRDPLDGGPSKRRWRTRKVYCLGCDRTGMDGLVEFPGLRVDEAPDPDWSAEPTVYEPDPELDGGTQKPAKFRRGVARKNRRAS